MRKPCLYNDCEIMATTNQTHDVTSESRIERMRKFLSSPLTRKKSSASKVFGCSLEVLAQRNSMESQFPVPFVISRICMFIQKTGLSTEGLFRISGNSRVMERLKNSFDQTGDASLESEGDVPSAAGLLKLFLRELPDPLIPEGLYSSLIEAPIDSPNKPEQVRSVLNNLPSVNYHVLKYLAKFLVSVASHEEHNRMGPSALGIVFGPNLFRVADDMQGLKEQSVTNHIVSLLISHYQVIFETGTKLEISTDTLEPLSISIPNMGDKEEDDRMESDLLKTDIYPKDIPTKVSLKQMTHNDRMKGNCLHEDYNPRGENILSSDSAGDLSPQPPKPKRRELDMEPPPTVDPQLFGSYCSEKHEQRRIAERLTPFKRVPLRTHHNSLDQEDFEVSSKIQQDLLLSISQPTPPGEEPISSEHRFSWPILKGLQQGDVMLSPFPRHLRKTSSLEAPLSPSAYRGHLIHLDPSLPPSPPVEHVKKEEDGETKLLSKKIHSLKKKVRQFEEVFENEHGYRPSYADKMTFPHVKKLLLELNKLRKELKCMKEGGINSPDQLANENRPSMEESLKEALHHLSDKRKIAQRPESVDDMNKEQVCEEKLAIQKALLRFENVHGRPVSKNERELMRPLYERYRSVKRLLSRSGGGSKGKDAELQPILEHVAMDFTSRADDSEASKSESWDTPVQDMDSSIVEDKTQLPTVNFHELPLTELVKFQQQARSDKHKLRRVLREFEDQFQRETGRKVQKEDRLPLEDMYSEYKHVKAHLKLLEALVSKRQPRNFI